MNGNKKKRVGIVDVNLPMHKGPSERLKSPDIPTPLSHLGVAVVVVSAAGFLRN